MKKLDFYILRKFISTFFFAVLVLAIIACVIDYSQKAQDFVTHHAPIGEILNFYKNFVPHISARLYPLFIFIASIFFTSKLAGKSEIIAMLATGMSFNRFMRPYIVGALLLGGLAFFSNHIVVPNANKQRLKFEDTFVHDNHHLQIEHTHLQLSPSFYVYVHTFNSDNFTGTRFATDSVSGTRLIEKMVAESFSYDAKTKLWTLRDVSFLHNDSISETRRHEAQIVRAYPFTPLDLKPDNDIKEALTTPELNRYIAKQELHGNANLNVYYVEKHRRTAQPFAGVILTIIAVSLASRKVRGGSGFHLAIGIIISALYVLSMQFSSTLSTNADLNPLLAVWIPNIVFAPVALFLYLRQIK